MSQQPVAYLDPDFLESAEARPVRILAEYLEPLRRFKHEKIQDTVVFFGSARIDSRERAERALATLRARGIRGADEAYHAELRKTRKAVEWARYYEDARELARLLTAWSATLQSENHRFVVTSGGGPGIMEAANRGAREAGGKTIGLNIRLPFEQGANPYITDGLQFEFHYFFMRKFWFAYLAKALVVFPGGFGTLDEMFELLTLAQTQKLAKKITVLIYGADYWQKVINLEILAEKGAIAMKDLELFQFADTPEEAFEKLKGSTDPDGLIQEGLPGQQFQAPQGKVKIDEVNHHTWLWARIGKANSDGQFDIVDQSKTWIRPDAWTKVLYPDKDCDFTKVPKGSKSGTITIKS